MPRTKEQFQNIREKTKKNILDAGLKVFSVKGFHGASISDIAKEAGISKGLAYNYFSSKLDIAEAILREMLGVFSMFDQIFEKIDDPFLILETSIRETFNHLKANKKFWKMYLSFATQMELSETTHKIFSEMISSMVIKLEEIFSKIGLPNPKVEALILGSLFDGISIDYLFDSENFPLDEVVEELIRKYSRAQLNKN